MLSDVLVLKTIQTLQTTLITEVFPYVSVSRIDPFLELPVTNFHIGEYYGPFNQAMRCTVS